MIGLGRLVVAIAFTFANVAVAELEHPLGVPRAEELDSLEPAAGFSS